MKGMEQPLLVTIDRAAKATGDTSCESLGMEQVSGQRWKPWFPS